jgi:hypothetical protein
LDFGNITGKIQTNADKFGMIVGFGTGGGGGFNEVMDSLQKLGDLHAPDFQTAISNFLASNTTKNGIVLAIAGYALDALDVPVIGKYGNAIMKFGFGYLGGYFAEQMLYFSTH